MIHTRKLLVAAAAVIGAVLALSAVTPRDLLGQVRAALFIDADQPARQSVVIRKATSTPRYQEVYTVPADKKLVVEHINCSTFNEAYFGLAIGSLNYANIVYSVPWVSTNAGVYVFDGSTRLYFEPGTELSLQMHVSNDSTCTITGYTVSANA
jgi:hypothetical protein